MNFTRIEFWICFSVICVIYQLIPSSKRKVLLLLASYGFYGSWDVRFISIIFLSTITDYFCGPMAASQIQKKSRLGLSLSLFINLGLLCFFKYISQTIQYLDGRFDLGLPVYEGIFEWGLPIGISFYTFQTLSYTIDCYKKKIKPERNFFSFALYVSFFPQLLAGPIERPGKLIPQINNLSKISLTGIQKAIPLLVWGLYKKLFVADNLYSIVKTIFLQPQLNIYEVALASFLVTLVVYCDFSAYSDLARGIARIFNVELCVNFRPFVYCVNPRQFWRCWHISLTTWIRDYVFIPLAFSGFGRRFRVITMFIPFVLIGIWHGPHVSWIVWGLTAAGFFIFFRDYLEKSFFDTPIINLILMFSMYCILGFLHEVRLFDTSKLFYMDFASFGEFFEVIKVISQYLLVFLIYEAFIFYGKDDDGPVAKWPLHWQGIFYGICCYGMFFRHNELSSNFVYFGF